MSFGVGDPHKNKKKYKNICRYVAYMNMLNKVFFKTGGHRLIEAVLLDVILTCQ